MQEYESLYRLNYHGMVTFERIFENGEPDSILGETSPLFAEPVEGTRRFRAGRSKLAKELAEGVLGAMGKGRVDELLRDGGFWSWLTFVLREELFECDSLGRRRIGERHRWYPGDPNDWRKAQRHLVRMPVLLLDSFGPDADHLLCGKPSVHSEIREQLTSQQDMFNRTFQRVARALYFDDCAGGLKRGAGGSGAGSPRRLAKVRQQLTVTWELEDLEWTEVLAKLPPEFDRFRPWPYSGS